MEGLQQILPINGAMNQDDDSRYVKSSDGEVIERINLRPNSIDGNRWLNKKILGNTLMITDKWNPNVPFLLPGGENKVIGWCKDYQSDAIIYFVYNDLEMYSILRYYQKEKVIEKIWYAIRDLDFEDTLIRAVVADKMLYWINGTKQPKSFVIHKAVNSINGTTEGDGTKYGLEDILHLDDNIFPMIKRPPRYKPEVIYTSLAEYPSGTVINYNNLRRRMFQFKYMYTYADNQQSAWSPISKVPLPDSEVSIEGEWDDNITKNNAIVVKYNTGNSYVKKITIAVRECQDRTAVGNFYAFEEIEKYDGTTNLLGDDEQASIYFLNTKKIENINTEINERYCDDVPLSASDIMLLDGKWCAMAMPVKGYDLIDVDYDLEAIETVRTMDYVSYPMETRQLYIPFHTTFVEILINSHFYALADYVISFNDNYGNNFNYSINSGAAYPGFPDTMAHAFAVLINGGAHTNFAGATHIGNIVRLVFTELDPCGDPSTLVAEIHPNITVGQAYFKNLKRGQYHPFVIIYNDGYGRYNIAQGDEELFSPYESCPVHASVSCRIKINNKPPDWATTYRIGYLPNKSYLYLLQLPFVRCLENGNADGVYTYSDIPSGYFFLPINQTINRIRLVYPNLIIPDYVFQLGDRVRSVCHSETYELVKEYTATTILVSDGTTEGTMVGYLVNTDLADDAINHEITLLEIYRPNPSIAITAATYGNIFLETGDEYAIITPGTATRRHDGDTPQTLDVGNNPLTPAIINLDFGDSFLRGRMGVEWDSSNTAVIVEDMHYTDFFISSGIDTGRITAKIESEQKELNSIVRGENFIEGSQINWLNVFLFSTIHFDASDIYGRIIGIEEMGGTLKVIQEHKEGSIMIGQVTAKQADVGDWIFIGDTVFGAYRRYEEDRGSVYRRSIATNNRYIYYFDESTGEFIRSSPNGQAPISKEYDMQNWFEKKAKSLREFTGDKDVVVSFDNDYEEVIISFRLGTTNETLVFSEKEGSKGWMFFVTYSSTTDVPECFAFFKDNLFSFLNGQLYLHGHGTNNTFYGKLHGCSLKTATNMYSSMMKRYSSIRMSSDENIWDVEFNIPEGVNYPRQKSILVPTIIREKENALYSDILRNIINMADIEDVNLLYVGNRLVGESMELTLSDTTSQSVKLGVIQVNFLIAR